MLLMAGRHDKKETAASTPSFGWVESETPAAKFQKICHATIEQNGNIILKVSWPTADAAGRITMQDEQTTMLTGQPFPQNAAAQKFMEYCGETAAHNLALAIPFPKQAEELAFK